jgi:lipopolysaccharide/colanic/teichoic acid biosynthesis glycosyltransferase
MIRGVRIAKRALDVAVATVGLALTLPLYPVIAALIVAESRGPIFFRQRRAGEMLGSGSGSRSRFREFQMLKFRTMRPDAEAKTGVVLAEKDDPRVTKVGRILRKTRMDEVPQFWNVLRGDMSLIGPRPERPELMRDLASAIPFFEERMRAIKPGSTGLAQVSLGYAGRPIEGTELARLYAQIANPFRVEGAEGAVADDMRMKLLCDLAYSLAGEKTAAFLRLELEILLRTPLVMLQGLGKRGLGR